MNRSVILSPVSCGHYFGRLRKSALAHDALRFSRRADSPCPLALLCRRHSLHLHRRVGALCDSLPNRPLVSPWLAREP